MTSSSSNLKNKATKGMIWTAVQKYTTMAIRFISGIILARLLEPEDYGCIGMLAIFMGIAEITIDAGFGSALIQKKQPSHVDYSTIFYFNLVMSAIMYVVLYVCAPFISSFYRMPLLSDVLRVQGIVLFIYALNIIQYNQLKKQLNFKVIAIATIVASIIGLGVTILMAYQHFGVWSLVTQELIIAFIPMLVYWVSSKWRPSFIFSMTSLKNLFSFGGFVLLSNILNKVGSQINGLLIGRLYNPAIMGYFSKASGTERLASTSVSSIMTQVTYPLYSAKQENKTELANIIRRITMTISFFTTPLMFLLCLIAEPLFVLLYSDKWLPSVPYFQLLCLAGVAVCLQSVNNQALAAIGKSKVMFKWTLVKKITGIILILVGILTGGVYGLLIAMIVDNWFIYFINAYNVSKHIGYPVIKQLRSLLPVIIASVLSFLIALIIGRFMQFSTYLDGLIKLLVFMTLYVGWAIISKTEAYLYSMNIIKSVILKK